MQLYELRTGDKAKILAVGGQGAFRKRILEMGFVQGQEVKMIGRAPMGDPTRYRVMGYEVSLRASEAKLVQVEALGSTDSSPSPLPEVENLQDDAEILASKGHRFHKGTAADRKQKKQLNVALVGNPNCGKTSIFNLTSGSKEHTGNYSGVTVDSRQASIRHEDYYIDIADLPGTYSLTAYTPEELYVRNYLLEQNPDLIVNVVDASNLERNLYLTLQLLETGRKVVVVLNMWDEFVERGDRLNRLMLGELLGAPCIPTVGRTGQGFEQLWNTVIAVHEGKWKGPSPILPKYGKALEARIEELRKCIQEAGIEEAPGIPYCDYALLKLLEHDPAQQQYLRNAGGGDAIMQAIDRISDALTNDVGLDSETYITDTRYGFLASVLKRSYAPSPRKASSTLKARIDRVLTHRIWGLPIFFGLMWLMFWATFTLGEYPMTLIEDGVGLLGELFSSLLPTGALQDLVVGGIIDGVGSVIIFLPQILILFLFISLFEDSGYMARAVFLMDRAMRSIGLHGRSFIPLVMGFGCNVPAVMATRTIEDRKVRLVTMMINPFMSCSARLQVYVLFIGAFFTDYPSTVLMGIYMLGIAVAIGASFLFRKTLLRGDESPFVMELPPYRLPTPRAILAHMWRKGAQYLRKMGTVILLASILIWFLSYYPRTTSKDKAYESRIELTQQQYATALTNAASLQTIKDSIEEEQNQAISQIQNEWDMLRQRESYLGRIGVAIEPALRPLGFDWRVGISLLTGVAAKEVVVSTLGVVLQTGQDQDAESSLLKKRVRTVKIQSGEKAGHNLFTPLTAWVLMIFVVLYVPCIAVVAAIRREAGSWKWAIFSAIYTTGIAYLAALLVYQIGSLFA